MAMVLGTIVDAIDAYRICIRPARFPAGGAGHITFTDSPAHVAWSSAHGEVWVSVGPHRQGVVSWWW